MSDGSHHFQLEHLNLKVTAVKQRDMEEEQCLFTVLDWK